MREARSGSLISAMPKPKKDRFVQQPPSVAYFKPQGIPMFQLEQVVLGVDEYEALRLVDLEGLQQQEAAERMKVSRATCARILEEAHRKVADALTAGKAIRIEGGSFVLGSNRYRCKDCNTYWDIPLRGAQAPPQALSCPRCKSDKVMDLGRQVGHGGRPSLEPEEAVEGTPPPVRGRHGSRGWRGQHPQP
jgi:predicted DNA-binding protein (UPF0251 family)